MDMCSIRIHRDHCTVIVWVVWRSSWKRGAVIRHSTRFLGSWWSESIFGQSQGLRRWFCESYIILVHKIIIYKYTKKSDDRWSEFESATVMLKTLQLWIFCWVINLSVKVKRLHRGSQWVAYWLPGSRLWFCWHGWTCIMMASTVLTKFHNHHSI